MRRHLGVAALLCAALTASHLAITDVGAATPARDVLAAGKDRAHDVALTRDRGLSTAKRRSVELKRLVVSQQRRAVRFELSLRRVDRSPGFTQIFTIDLEAKGYGFAELMVATHPMSWPTPRDGLEHSITIEGTDTPQGYVTCDRLQMSLPDGASRWWVDVPRRCLPADRVKIGVYAQIINTIDMDEGTGGDKQFSHDELRVKGRHLLHGTAKPAY